jgi:uncharacterized protein (DUF1919 family)
MSEEEKKSNVEEEAVKKWDSLPVEEKIKVIANNAMSRAEAYQRLESILEKIQAIALKVENLELKNKLKVVQGGSELS